MLDATKVKPQRVAVLAVLRPEGFFLLTKYSAKMQSLTRREFTQEVNDRVGIVVCEVGRQNHIILFFYHFAYVRALLDLDFWM